MCAWLLMFIENEYNYCIRNSIQIIKGSDNCGSDNRGSTVLHKFSFYTKPTIYYHLPLGNQDYSVSTLS